MNFIPGPYKIFTFDQTENHLIQIRSVSEDRLVAAVICEGATAETPKEWGTAWLLTAAPELFHALELFVAQYGGNKEREKRPEMRAARAALLKATTGKG